MSRIRLLLVDDHAVVRQGLRALLEAETDMEVVGEAENGRAAVASARRTRPDVVVMDVVMPELNGGEATRQILEVLRLIARGLLNKQIAGELGIAKKTVEKHRQRVMDKTPRTQ